MTTATALLDYDLLERQLNALLDTEDALTNCAQTAAFIYQTIPQLNWVGFYLQRRPQTLILGPFQGQPACNPITFAQGVCGLAARTRQTQRVKDVDALDYHIACDSASRSELVIPLEVTGRLWGVLDIDSPIPRRFSTEDQAGIERLAAIFLRSSSQVSLQALGNEQI